MTCAVWFRPAVFFFPLCPVTSFIFLPLLNLPHDIHYIKLATKYPIMLIKAIGGNAAMGLRTF